MKRRLKIHSEKGSTMVELALALPILMVILFGMVQLMLLVNTKTIFEHAAYEGMRTAVVVKDKAVVAKRVRRVLKSVPRGAGFLRGKPKLFLQQSGEHIILSIEGRTTLLPFFRQTSMAFGGDGTVSLSAKASGRQEPYIGL